MKRLIVCIALACVSLTQVSCVSDMKVADENLLWPDGIKDNPIRYDEPNRMRTHDAHPDAPLDTCRVYSNVQTPTYYIYQTLCENEVPAEIHIYAKGKHGFTLGLGTGHSTTQ